MKFLNDINKLSRYNRTTKMDSKLRYLINHCDVEILSYSSKTLDFEEKNHPLEALNDIDYHMSYKRHYIKGSDNEFEFVYHEEVLFPPMQIPVKNMFKGFVLEFDTLLDMEERVFKNHHLLKEMFEVSYIYVINHKISFYIPQECYIENALKNKEYKEEVSKMVLSIKKLIKIKKELETVLKEELV